MRLKKILEEQVIKNEADRVIDQKYLLLHYVHLALPYHCTSMQLLTKLFTNISAIDPREALNTFIKTYNITTYREEELPKLFNYIVGSTQRKLEAIRMGNSVPPVSTYPGDSNAMRNIVNPNINNTVASSAIKSVDVNQIIKDHNLIGNNAYLNQIGKNPPVWIFQNFSGVYHSGFNRGAIPLPRNTRTSKDIFLNNK